ncbi:protein spaetzle 3 [Episyrphus balteatus]|uniref:protein spaetzle 3 n=1 Tax=Episyrphus balteatus TaxID=286459 RepID=UPI002485329B|nr:protein spaetzle 3 [Episyrphus balteatus]
MALANFSLPFGNGLAAHNWAATLSPIQQVQRNSNTNDLLYGPAGHQQQDELPTDYYKNNPYLAPHAQEQYQYNNNNNNNRRKGGQTYLPPIPPTSPGVPTRQQSYDQRQKPQQFSHQNQQGNYQHSIGSQQPQQPSTRTYGENNYSRFPPTQPQQVSQAGAAVQVTRSQQQQYYTSSYNTQTHTAFAAGTADASQREVEGGGYGVANQPNNNDQDEEVETARPPVNTPAPIIPASGSGGGGGNPNDPYPERPPGFTRVQAGQGSRTQVHAVLDYDVEEGEEDDYYDAEDNGSPVSKNGDKKGMPTVTPIQGPIFLKNGSVPVVPLFSYPTVNNGSFVQIPIWWTALSVALGLDVRGDVIKGVPCIKRYHQLFCPTAGNSYPIDKIERFIDDNKALMRRMYGDFEMNMDSGGPKQQTKRKRRFIDEPDIFIPPGAFPAVPEDIDSDHEPDRGDTYFGKLRNKRQSNNRSPKPPFNNNNAGQGGSSTGRLDACESKIEIVTPYWASNSAGKIRAIVNTQHFEQAIHQEICSKARTPRCEKDCGCEQKYKWHRLLAYDPDNDCKGIFMDWFLFPSCCVCRCNP